MWLTIPQTKVYESKPLTSTLRKHEVLFHVLINDLFNLDPQPYNRVCNHDRSTLAKLHYLSGQNIPNAIKKKSKKVQNSLCLTNTKQAAIFLIPGSEIKDT